MMPKHQILVAPLLSLTLALPATAYAGRPVLASLSPAEGEGEGEGEDEDEDELSPEEEANLEEAKVLYTKAEKLAKKKKWKEAEELYEQAYYLVPGKHGFAHKVGTAAHKAGDCEKALEYMIHFMQYSDPEKQEDMRDEARDVLKDLLEQGCATEDQLMNYHLDADEREQKALELFTKAEELAAADNYAEATDFYEQAYYLVPDKIGFAHKVGMAAFRSDNCDKAHEYLIHFVEYADPTKYADKMAEATQIINELEDSGCVTSEEMAAHQLENPFEIDPDANRDTDERKRGASGNTMLIAGSALAVAGLAGIGVGTAGFVLAGSSQRKLDTLASTDTASGLPDGDWACRGVGDDQCPPTLERQINSRRLMGALGMGIGGAALVAGGALIAWHFLAPAKDDDGGSDEAEWAKLDAIGPLLLPGGGGAAASIRF